MLAERSLSTEDFILEDIAIGVEINTALPSLGMQTTLIVARPALVSKFLLPPNRDYVHTPTVALLPGCFLVSSEFVNGSAQSKTEAIPFAFVRQGKSTSRKSTNIPLNAERWRAMIMEDIPLGWQRFWPYSMLMLGDRNSINAITKVSLYRLYEAITRDGPKRDRSFTKGMEAPVACRFVWTRIEQEKRTNSQYASQEYKTDIQDTIKMNSVWYVLTEVLTAPFRSF